MKIQKYTRFFESGNLFLQRFNALSLDEKIERLSSQRIYDSALYYHVSPVENADQILKMGIIGDELWFSKEKPHKEYSTGVLFACDLSKQELFKDVRWEDKYQIFICREPISAQNIVRFYDWFEDVEMREDKVLDYILKRNKNPKDLILEFNL
jgi:hypothetical protein